MDILRRRGGSPSTSDEGPSPDELKGWTVRFSPAGGQGGWASVKDWELLEHPPTKTEFEINTGELDPGTYRLFWIQQDTERLQMPPDGMSWKKTVEGEVDEEPDPEHVANRAAQKAVSAVQHDQAGSVIEGSALELADSPEDLLKLMSMFNEDWLHEQGSHAVARAWGLAGDNELDFEDYKENPLGAFFFDSYKEPQQLREFGQSIGAGGSAFLDGLLKGADDPEEIFADEIAEAERKAEEAENRDPEDIEPRASRSRTITAEDLGIDMPDPSDAAQVLDDTDANGAADQEGQDGVEAGVEADGLTEEGTAVETDPGASAGADGGEEPDDAATEADADGADVYGDALTDEDIAKAMEEL